MDSRQGEPPDAGMTGSDPSGGMGQTGRPAYDPGRGPAGPGWPGRGIDPFGRRRKSSALAAVLSLMPGLGQIYVGHYQRGFLHVVVIAGVISLLAGGMCSPHAMDLSAGNGVKAFLGLFLAFFWLYNIIDAARLATFYNEALAGATAGDLKKELVLPSRGGSFAGGIILVSVGLLLFFNTMFDLSLLWLRDWWPIVPIGFGVYLIAQAVREKQRRG